MNNIKILFCVFAFIISYQSNAQTVGYTYKALAAEDCKRVGGQVPDSFLSWNCCRSATSGYQCVPLGVLAKVMRNVE